MVPVTSPWESTSASTSTYKQGYGSSSYDPVRCRNRHIALQEFRKDAGCDVLVFVPGSDGGSNRGSELGTAFLFEGKSGPDLLLTPANKKYQEIVVGLREDRCIIFANNEKIAAELGILCAMWSPKIVVPTKEEIEDEDKYDLCKIHAFIEMVVDCKSVAFLDEKHESWPLVQAFAIDDFGHGFLSLKRAVKNLQQPLVEFVFSEFDTVTCENLYFNKLKMLRKPWTESMTNPANEDACEQHYLYGKMTYEDDLMELLPFVKESLFPTPEAKVEAVGDHFTVHEVVDPATRVYLARTILKTASEKLLDQLLVARKLVNTISTISAPQMFAETSNLVLKKDAFEVHVEALNAMGLKSENSRNSGCKLMTVRVRNVDNGVVWGDTYLVCRLAPTSKECSVAPLTSDFIPTFLFGEIITKNKKNKFAHPTRAFIGDGAFEIEDGGLSSNDDGKNYTFECKRCSFGLSMVGNCFAHGDDVLCEFSTDGVSVWLVVPTSIVTSSGLSIAKEAPSWWLEKRNSGELICDFFKKALYSDAYSNRLPTKARRILMMEFTQNNNAAPEINNGGTTVVWLYSFPCGTEALSLAEEISRGGTVVDMRRVFRQSDMHKVVCSENIDNVVKKTEAETTSDVTVVLNDIGYPILPPANAYVIVDLRYPTLYLKKKYTAIPWLQKLLAKGCCHAVVLPTEYETIRSKAWQTAHEHLQKVVKAVNPEVRVFRGVVSLEKVIRVEAGLVEQSQERVLSRPHCLDQEEKIPERMFCVTVPATSTYVDRDDIVKEFCPLFNSSKIPFEVVSIEVHQVATLSDKKVSMLVVSPDEVRHHYHAGNKTTDQENTPPSEEMLKNKAKTNNNNKNQCKMTSRTGKACFTVWAMTDGLSGKSTEDEETLIREAVEDAVSKCVLSIPDEELEVVSPEELFEITTKSRLPDGWHFDGTCFVDYLGKRHLIHPWVDEIREKEMAARIKKLQARNYELRNLRAMYGVLQNLN